MTGLKVKHLSQQKIPGFKVPGVADIHEGSKTWPYILAFINKDFATLTRLHAEQNQKLRQFMVEIDLPFTDELKGYRATLHPGSPDIKIRGKYVNKSSNTVVWSGVFTSKEHFMSHGLDVSPNTASVILKVFQPSGISRKIILEINPGVNHFVEIESKELVSQTPYNFGLPNVFNWVPKKTFLGMLSQEK